MGPVKQSQGETAQRAKLEQTLNQVANPTSSCNPKHLITDKIFSCCFRILADGGCPNEIAFSSPFSLSLRFRGFLPQDLSGLVFFFFPCWPQGNLAAELDGAALATEGKMVPANGILVSQMRKTEDSTLAGGFDVVHVHKDFVSLLRLCRVQICDGTHSSFSSLCNPVGTHAKI